MNIENAEKAAADAAKRAEEALERADKGLPPKRPTPELHNGPPISVQEFELSLHKHQALEDFKRTGLAGHFEAFQFYQDIESERQRERYDYQNNEFTILDQTLYIETVMKPLGSTNEADWVKAGGRITIDSYGTWHYTDWEGNTVSYPRGVVDFKSAGMVRREYPGLTGNRDADRKILRSFGPKVPNTELHHANNNIGQAVDRRMHKRFTHYGGVYYSKGNSPRWIPPTRIPLRK